MTKKSVELCVQSGAQTKGQEDESDVDKDYGIDTAVAAAVGSQVVYCSLKENRQANSAENDDILAVEEIEDGDQDVGSLPVGHANYHLRSQKMVSGRVK